MALIAERVEQARRGENPSVICRTRGGWAVMGDEQFLPGYALLLADPVVGGVNDLTGESRTRFLENMAALGDAVAAAPLGRPFLRVNYSIYCNLEPELHAHVVPRFADEPADLIKRPHWFYPQADRAARPFDAERDAVLQEFLRDRLRAAGVAVD